jgi:hypothetical protein
LQDHELPAVALPHGHESIRQASRLRTTVFSGKISPKWRGNLGTRRIRGHYAGEARGVTPGEFGGKISAGHWCGPSLPCNFWCQIRGENTGNGQSKRESMPRGKATFRKSDLQRAIIAARAGGLVLGRVEIEPGGKIILMAATVSNDNVSGAVQEGRNEWDDAA